MFEELFTRRGTIASYRARPCWTNGSATSGIAHKRASDGQHCARLRRISSTSFISWACGKPSASACPGSRRQPRSG